MRSRTMLLSGSSGGAGSFTTISSTSFNSEPTAGNVFNESGGDVDFRVETDTNPNAFVIDSGVFAGRGAVAIGGAVPANQQLAIPSPAVTANAASAFYRNTMIPAGNVTIPAGTASEVATLLIFEPLITATGTVADAWTVIIASSPTEGTRNGSLWVQDGKVRFSNLPTASAGLPTGHLWNNAGVVNVV